MTEKERKKYKNSKSGIYQIKSILNNKIYIGSSNIIQRRWSQHKNSLRGNKHENQHLQNAWNKYKEENFEFSIIEIVEDESKLLEKEQNWIDLLKPCDRNIGYNISLTVENHIISEATKQKMHIASRGENNHFSKLNEEQVLNINEMLNNNYSCTDISKELNINRTTITDIKRGRSWSYLTNIEYKEKDRIQRVTEEQVIKIYEMIKSGYKIKKIADMYNVSYSVISDISRGRTWSKVINNIKNV